MVDVKFGRNAPHSSDTHPRLRVAQFLNAAKLPSTPSTVDYVSKVNGWPVYLNDQIGDCTCAAVGHIIEAATAYGQGTTVEISDKDVLKAYEAVGGYVPGDPSTDNGAVMQDVLSYWRKTGVGGHKILAFAEVDVTNLNEVYAALYLFGHVYIGVNFPQSAMDQFDAGKPWTVVARDGGIIGGHAVDLGWRDGAALEVITWGRVQGLDEAWWHKYVEEAWIAITPEWVNAAGSSPEGIDVAALNAAYTELTGQAGPFPVQPTPVPTPTPQPPAPTPGPDPADLVLAAGVTRWANQRHYGAAKHVALAIRQWLHAKGL